MRFYTQPHRRYCGIDLHAKTMFLCVLDADGNTLLHKNFPTEPAAFLHAIAPHREGLVVAAECTLSWYWLADLCARENIPFVLGHALYMRAIHGAKAKSDRIDSLKIAALLRGKLFPMAYVYPDEMRATRDLLRRRLHFVRHRGQLMAHIQIIHHQYNRPAPGKKLASKSNRDDIAQGFPDPAIHLSLEADLQLIAQYDQTIAQIELAAVRAARGHDNDSFERLKTIPGVGKILGLTILYEIHQVERFPTVKQFSSYARLVKVQHESAGKLQGTGGHKIGNPFLKWAFSEAAVLFLAKCPDGKRIYNRLQRKHGTGKALSLFAHRIGRAAYFMLKNKVAFDRNLFFKGT